MAEFFDVLDEKGNYTNKTEERYICHRDGLYHKAVALFIINSKGQVLLQRRSPNKRMWPNMWDITAGGHVDAGEFGYKAVIREAKEELGIDLCNSDLTFIGCSVSNNIKGDIKNNHFNEYYVTHKDIDLDTITLQSEEVAEVKWFNKEDIISRVKNNYEGITDKEGCWEYLLKYYELS